MKVQLLLPLALAGLLCSFTRASPTTNPPNSMQEETTTLEELHTRFEEITDPGTLPTVPQALPDVFSTAGSVDASEVPTHIFTPTQDPIPDTTVVVTEATTVTASSLPPAEITLLPTSPLPEILTTENTEHEETDGHLPEWTESPTNSGAEGLDKTNTEEFLEDGPGTGQIVGIVIGAIVAVVIVIAVVIAVLRRMGKYSTAKSSKPAKKDSVVVAPLRKKSTKQQKRAKFWKS